jgi:hypothetical protein
MSLGVEIETKFPKKNLILLTPKIYLHTLNGKKENDRQKQKAL